MKRVLVTLLALSCVAAPVHAQKRRESKPDKKEQASKKESSKKDAAKKEPVEKEWKETPGYPAWSEEDKQAHKDDKDWALHGDLWNPVPPAEGEEPQEEKPIELPPQTPAEEIESSKEAAGESLPEKWWTAYFAEKPKDLLVDPQGLLSKEEAAEVREQLAAHAKDSGIDLVVYLFATKQEIPGDVRWEETTERLYYHPAGELPENPEGYAYPEQRPTVLMAVFAGAPKRTMIQLTPSLLAKISVGERKRALEEAVTEALESRQSAKQVHTLVEKMLLRVYWMDETMHGKRVKSEPVVVLSDKPKEEKASKKAEIKKALMDLLPYWPLAAMAVGGVIALGLLGWIWRLRARYRFPDIPVERRLGGPHAAGVGAVLSFHNPRVATAEQKDKVPDRIL